MYFIIYETKNLANNKVYRGAHKCKSLDDGYLGSNRQLNFAIKKYGINNFQRTILEFCENEKQMYEREIFWVDIDFVKRKDTYNLKVGGFGGWAKHSQDAKDKIRKARTGKKFSDEVKKKMSETHKKSKKSFTLSEEAKRKIGEAAKKRVGEKNGFFGKKHSEESKLKIAARHKKNLAS